jgi:hypothetical protein
MRQFSACLLLASAFVATNSARAEVTLIGVAVIPGDASDLSDLKGKTSDGTPLNRLGGLGSAIAYTGKGDEYIFASDRGPKDGTVEFPCRYHRMSIRVKPGTKEPVSLKLTATTLLTNESGTPFNGSLNAFEHKHAEKNLRLDPEGIRVSRTGTFFISDEYGPVVYEFDAKGKRLQSLPVPAHFQIPKPGKSPNDELPPKTTIGRQPNRGMEGLAISPDGTKLYGAMQSPLIQDGALNEKNERIGVNCRILEIDIATKKTREFVYQLDSPANGVCEILAVNDHEFLVLERDSLGGKDAAFKKVFLIDIAGATDVSSTATLPAKQLPATVTAVKKKPFLDLLAKRYKIAGGDCPEKFEGLAFGPALPDGRITLIVTADNDFVTEKPFQVYAFAIDKSDLPNFQPQQFGSKK